MKSHSGVKLTALAVLLSGCGSTATYLAPQQTVYYKDKDQGSITLTDTDLNSLFELKCMKNMPQGPLTHGESKEASQCLYIAVDAAKATSSTATTRTVRDKAIAYLLNVSETNCANFLDRAFANKAGMDVTKGLAEDVATGIGTVTAFNTPAVTAALGITNLVVGKTVDNVTSTFYFNQTFQAFEAAVITERARIKSEIISKQAQRPVVSTDTAVQYTLFDAMADIRQYDAACSMRVGLAKLIETQGEKKRLQIEQSANADAAAKSSSLETAKADNSTDLKADVPAKLPAPSASTPAPAPVEAKPAKK